MGTAFEFDEKYRDSILAKLWKREGKSCMLKKLLERFKFYFLLTTSLLVSAITTLVIWLFRK